MTWGFAMAWLVAAAVAWGAYRADALTLSGAWAAWAVGGLVFGFGGWWGACLLLLFFVSSSALSHLFSHRKHTLSEKFSKGSRRDWGQVAANGALAALLAVVYGLRPQWGWAAVAFGGALAAVNADTWATELGVLSRALPRHILSGRAVPRGTSGGVSFLGSGAALAGAALIGLCAAVWGGWQAGFAVALGGWAGAWMDSLLGATVQAMYYCPHCEKETEHAPLHTCGHPTTWRRGWRWMDNDVVNFLASLTGALMAVALWRLL